MPSIVKKSVFAAKIETTPGTAESLSGADAVFNVLNALVVTPTFDIQQRTGQGGFGKISSAVGDKVGTLQFSVDFVWDGTATLQNFINTLWPACGLVRATNTFTPRTEAPGSNVKTLTIGGYVNGKLKMLRGASGNLEISFPTAKTIQFNFSFTGLWVSEEDVAILAPTYPSATPRMRYADTTTTYDGISLCSATATFSINNTLTPIECQNDETGYAYVMITDRTPTLVADPQSVLVATQDRYGMFETEAEEAFSTAVPGPNSSVFTLAAPKAQIISCVPAERTGIEVDNMTLQFNRNGSSIDQEFSFVFTPSA